MEIIGGFGLFFVFVLVVLGIILPISVYSAQKWAYRCYRELEKLNQNFDQFLRSSSTR